MQEFILNEKYQFKRKLYSDSIEEKKFLFNDYILYFLSLIIEVKDTYEIRVQILIFLNMILKLSILNFNEYTSYLNDKTYIDEIIDKKIELTKYFEKMCLFLENNKKFLSKILKSLNEFLIIYPEYNNLFIILYRKSQIKNDNILLKIFEIFLNCINDELKFSLFFNPEKKEKYIKFLQKNEVEFRSAFSLIKKEEKESSFSLLNIEIFLYVIKNKKNEKNNNLLENTLKYLREEEENNYLNPYEICLNQDKINFTDKIFINLLIKQFQKNKKNLKVFNIFLSDKKFIQFSMLFIGKLFEEYLDINSLKNKNANVFVNIPKELENKINNIISEKNNNLFKDLLIYYFESYYENYYFNDIKEEDRIKRNEIIIKNRTLELILDYLKYSDENATENLQLLYRIALIKIYFRYFIDIMYDSKNGNEDINFDSIVRDEFLLKSRRLDIIKEMRNNLQIKCNENAENLEKFIVDKKIFYLEKDYDNQIKVDISYISNKVPNIYLLKENFNKITNKGEFPLLNQYLNNENQIKYLRSLPIINYISNIMLKTYSYRNTSEEIKEEKMKEGKNKIKDKSQELYNNFENKMLEYIKSYNSLLGENNKKFKLEEDYSNESIEKFLVNENNDKNQLNYILNNFIKYQNDFILKISEKYFKNNNIEEIDVQEASEKEIPKFCASDKEFIEILMNNSRIKLDEVNNIKFDFSFDFEEMESDLAEKIIPGLKKFRIGIINIMKYFGDSNKDGIMNDFRKKYKLNNLNQKQEELLNKFISNYETKAINEFLSSIINLMVFLLSSDEFNSDTKLNNALDKIEENYKEKIKVDLIKTALNLDLKNDEIDEDDDILYQINYGTKGDDSVFEISNLYSIYKSVEKKLKLNK